MKRENIHVGMRVKVKKFCSLGDIVTGKYATVIAEPYDGFKGVYVKCIVDDRDDVYTFSVHSIKCSDEQPVVGDRILILSEGYAYFSKGASGVVVSIDKCGNFWVDFDRGDYRKSNDDQWCVQKDQGHKYAIIRNVEGLK